MAERFQTPSELLPTDTVAAEGTQGRRAALVDEVAALVLRGRSAFVLAADGMGGPQVVQAAGRRLAAGHGDVLVVRPGVAPFTSVAARIDEVVRLLVRAARERAADDVVWDGVADAWAAEYLETPAEGEDAPAAVDVATALGRLVTLLREVAELAGLVVVAVDDLAAWLPAEAGDEAARQGLEAGLRALVESHTPPVLRLVVAGAPDLVRPRRSPLPALVAALEQVPVEPLDEAEVSALLAREAPALDAEDARWVYRMVGGHPRLVRALGAVLARWRSRRGPLDDAARLSLTAAIDDAARAVVEEAIAILRRAEAGALLDRLFAAAVTAEPAAFTPGELMALWPLGLVDAADRIPERLRAIVARGAVLLGGAQRSGSDDDTNDGRLGLADDAGDDEPRDDDERDGDGDTDGGPPELGRKERLLFNYLRERPGVPVHWKELAAAYFVGDPATLQDDEKALRSLRATVNRINGKASPSEAAARGGWKLVRWSRDARGFYVDREALAQLGH